MTGQGIAALEASLEFRQIAKPEKLNFIEITFLDTLCLKGLFDMEKLLLRKYGLPTDSWAGWIDFSNSI